MALAGIIISVFGIIIGVCVAVYICLFQRQRGRISIDVSIIEKEEEKKSINNNDLYQNNSSLTSLVADIEIKNAHVQPITVSSYILTIIPDFPWWVHPIVEKLSKEYKVVTLYNYDKYTPETYNPYDVKNIQLSGYEIAKLLGRNGLEGSVSVRFGLFDDKKNIYQSKKIVFDIEQLQKTKGKLLFGTIS